MRDLIKFRLINKIEKKIIIDSLLKLSLVILPYLEKNDYRLYISSNRLEVESKFPSIYLISRDQGNLLEKILKVEIVCSAGVYFGFIRKGIFHLSLEGAEFFLNENKIPDQNILIISNKGEKAILYGNPILKRMIFNIPSAVQKDAILLVLNESRELIALARSEIDYTNYKLLNQGDIVANILTDKGYYLRRKQ